MLKSFVGAFNLVLFVFVVVVCFVVVLVWGGARQALLKLPALFCGGSYKSPEQGLNLSES